MSKVRGRFPWGGSPPFAVRAQRPWQSSLTGKRAGKLGRAGRAAAALAGTSGRAQPFVRQVIHSQPPTQRNPPKLSPFSLGLPSSRACAAHLPPSPLVSRSGSGGKRARNLQAAESWLVDGWVDPGALGPTTEVRTYLTTYIVSSDGC